MSFCLLPVHARPVTDRVLIEYCQWSLVHEQASTSSYLYKGVVTSLLTCHVSGMTVLKWLHRRRLLRCWLPSSDKFGLFDEVGPRNRSHYRTKNPRIWKTSGQEILGLWGPGRCGQRGELTMSSEKEAPNQIPIRSPIIILHSTTTSPPRIPVVL